MNEFELEVLLLGVEADTWLGDVYLMAMEKAGSRDEALLLARTTLAALAGSGLISVSCLEPGSFDVLREVDVADLSDDSLASGMTEDGLFISFEATDAGDVAFRTMRGWDS